MKIHLKKILVSFFVILGFVFYAIYQRNGNGQQNFVINPPTTNSPVTQSSSDLASSTTESQPSSNPPLTSSKNDDGSENDNESYSTSASQSSTNQSTTTTGTTIDTSTSATTSTTTTVANALYKDGQYDGRIADAYYGNVQVRAIIQGGKLTDVQFLSYPSDRNQSREINSYALPILKSEAIKAQSAKVNIVSGATNTSSTFISSLSSALSQAKV